MTNSTLIIISSHKTKTHPALWGICSTWGLCAALLLRDHHLNSRSILLRAGGKGDAYPSSNSTSGRPVVLTDLPPPDFARGIYNIKHPFYTSTNKQTPNAHCNWIYFLAASRFPTRRNSNLRAVCRLSIAWKCNRNVTRGTPSTCEGTRHSTESP